MTNPSLRRKKITLRATPEGLELAEKSLIRLGFESKANFAKSQLLSRTTVTKFFQSEPIQLDSFKRICEVLRLNWEQIAGITTKEQLGRLENSDHSSSLINQGLESMPMPYSQVTVIDKQTKTIKLEIKLKGHISSVENFKVLELVLQQYSGDSIRITDAKEGSIRLFVEGFPEDIERLVSRIKSGEITQITSFPVENVQILGESSDEASSESEKKWHLVQSIVNLRGQTRDLRGADLSDADLSDANLIFAQLSHADLSGADLSGAKLSGADLSGADLSGAKLSGAKLSGAKLSGADLSGVDLRGADLRGANLSGADLSGADLSYADLSGADLNHTKLSHADLSHADLSHANLSYADLSGADLSGADLRQIKLKGAKINKKTQIQDKWHLVWEIFNQPVKSRILTNADLSHTNLSGADLSRVNLRDSNLSGAKLSGAKLSGADLSGAALRGTDLSGADLSGAALRGTDLRGAALRGTDLSGADLSRVNLSGADLSGADLSRVNLSSFDLNHARLRGARLRDTGLSSANLSGADLNNSDLKNANLSGANLSDADLRNTNLSGTDLNNANVVDALFGNNSGITEDMRRDLQQRGAIFGDRPPVPTSR